MEIFKPYINTVSVIIIDPKGNVYDVKDNGYDDYNAVFSNIQNKQIREIVKDLNHGVLKSSALAKKGYIVMIGTSPSMKKNIRDFNNKHLYLPQEVVNDDQKIAFKSLIDKFDFTGIPTERIPIGFSLIIHIGNRMICSIDIKNNSDKAKKEKLLRTIEEARLQIEQGNFR